MKYFILLFISFLIHNLNLYSQQNKIFIEYEIITKNLNNLSFQKLGLRSHLDYDADFEFDVKKNKKSKIEINLLTNGLYKLADGFDGHIVYLDNGESINFKLTEIKNLSSLLEKTYFPTFHSLSATGKFSWHYTYFDELYKRTSLLHRFELKTHLKNPMKFKSNCDLAYKIGKDLLDSLYDKNKVSLNFKKIISEELNAIYVSSMCATLMRIKKSKINSTYFEKLNTLHFDDSTLAVKCNDYMQAGALYTYYIHNSFNPNVPFLNLPNEINSIIKNFSGIVKDRLLAWQIEDYIGKAHPSFDTCYQIFLANCKNARIKKEVVNKVGFFIIPKNEIKLKKLKNILEFTKIENFENIKSSLSSVLSDTSLNIIDCWATWCSPCKEQLPFIHDFEKKFKSKVNIIYLSFDKDEIKWKSFLKKKEITKNQFIVGNNFNSEFCKYFNIQTIPRYILLSKGGLSVLNYKMPLPIEQEELEEEINNHLK
jgi:thiol-disulfide isomerase/thioredoxin